MGPRPEKAYLEAKIEIVKDPAELPFDPAKLKKRYQQEREKRLPHTGLQQYRYADGHLSNYLTDPWVETGFTRDPVEETIEALIIGGGYGAQLVAVRLIEAGIKNIKMIEKAGDFGGTW